MTAPAPQNWLPPLITNWLIVLTRWLQKEPLMWEASVWLTPLSYAAPSGWPLWATTLPLETDNKFLADKKSSYSICRNWTITSPINKSLLEKLITNFKNQNFCVWFSFCLFKLHLLENLITSFENQKFLCLILILLDRMCNLLLCIQLSEPSWVTAPGYLTV